MAASRPFAFATSASNSSMSSVIVVVSVSTSFALTAVIQRWIAASSATRLESGAANAGVNASKPLNKKTANRATRHSALFMQVVTHDPRHGSFENERARTVASAGPRDLTINVRARSVVVLVMYCFHRCLRIDEAVPVELAIAVHEQVEELAAEWVATFEFTEEARAARDDLAGGDQHAAAEQIRGVASRSAARTRDIRFIAIDAE